MYAQLLLSLCTCLKLINLTSDLGDRKTIFEIAQAFKPVYGFEPKLERLGSLDDLKARMYAIQSENPADVFSYMPL